MTGYVTHSFHDGEILRKTTTPLNASPEEIINAVDFLLNATQWKDACRHDMEIKTDSEGQYGQCSKCEECFTMDELGGNHGQQGNDA